MCRRTCFTNMNSIISVEWKPQKERYIQYYYYFLRQLVCTVTLRIKPQNFMGVDNNKKATHLLLYRTHENPKCLPAYLGTPDPWTKRRRHDVYRTFLVVVLLATTCPSRRRAIMYGNTYFDHAYIIYAGTAPHNDHTAENAILVLTRPRLRLIKKPSNYPTKIQRRSHEWMSRLETTIKTSQPTVILPKIETNNDKNPSFHNWVACCTGL